MTHWRLENARFCVDVCSTGAQLVWLWDKVQRRQWLWQPDPAVWNHCATLLFPVVGRLIHGGLWQDKRFFPLAAHGFLRHQHFHCREHRDDVLFLNAQASDETLCLWPWRWRIEIGWRLTDNGLHFMQQVINEDNTPFAFSIGWHPGFALPVSGRPGWRIDFNDQPVTGPFPTRDRTLALPARRPVIRQFNLHETTFAEGAVYFGLPQNSRLSVHDPAGKTVIEMTLHQYPWLALWGVPGADLLCIESLAGTTDDPDFNGQISRKRGLQWLDANERQTFSVIVCFPTGEKHDTKHDSG